MSAILVDLLVLTYSKPDGAVSFKSLQPVLQQALAEVAQTRERDARRFGAALQATKKHLQRASDNHKAVGQDLAAALEPVSGAHKRAVLLQKQMGASKRVYETAPEAPPAKRQRAL